MPSTGPPKGQKSWSYNINKDISNYILYRRCVPVVRLGGLGSLAMMCLHVLEHDHESIVQGKQHTQSTCTHVDIVPDKTLELPWMRLPPGSQAGTIPPELLK